jgi:hypothetical protein
LTHRRESDSLMAMTRRLQVLFEDEELEEIQELARRRRMTMAEWVRQSLRHARESDRRSDPRERLDAIKHAAGHAFPTGDIDQMLSEIERGYDVHAE